MASTFPTPAGVTVWAIFPVLTAPKLCFYVYRNMIKAHDATNATTTNATTHRNRYHHQPPNPPTHHSNANPTTGTTNSTNADTTTETTTSQPLQHLTIAIPCLPLLGGRGACWRSSREQDG